MKALGRIKHRNGMITAGSKTLQEQESHKVFVLTDIKNIGVSVDFLMKIGERGTDTAVFSLCITQYRSVSTRSVDIMVLSGSVRFLMLISSQIPAMHDFRKFCHLERNFQFRQNSSKIAEFFHHVWRENRWSRGRVSNATPAAPVRFLANIFLNDIIYI